MPSILSSAIGIYRTLIFVSTLYTTIPQFYKNQSVHFNIWNECCANRKRSIQKPSNDACALRLIFGKGGPHPCFNVLNKNVLEPNFYPQLKKRIVKIYGYLFWTEEENFNLENHVPYLDPEFPDKPVLKSKLQGKINDNLSSAGFDCQKSPWEIVLVPNVIDPNNPRVKSALFLRVSHCLMDGISIINFIQKTGKPFSWHAAQVFNQKRNQFNIKTLTTTAIKFIELVWLGPLLAVQTISSNDRSPFLNSFKRNQRTH